LELAQRLVAEIVAIDQEQDAPRAGVLDQPIAEVAGSEGLTAAGRHLNERARVVRGERPFEVFDRLDLAVAQVLGDERRHLLQAAAQRGGLGERVGERFGLVEGEDQPRPWLGVAQIAE
jgi:hypothetical protein